MLTVIETDDGVAGYQSSREALLGFLLFARLRYDARRLPCRDDGDKVDKVRLPDPAALAVTPRSGAGPTVRLVNAVRSPASAADRLGSSTKG